MNYDVTIEHIPPVAPENTEKGAKLSRVRDEWTLENTSFEDFANWLLDNYTGTKVTYINIYMNEESNDGPVSV